MSAKRDYYEVLGVDRNAGENEIKAAYRKLALKFHPDRNPGDQHAEENFKEAAEAYDVLHDPQKRNIYNQFGHQGLEGSGFSGFGGFEDIFSSFGDIFEDFFGFGSSRRSRRRVQKGADLRYDLTLSFMDAAFGTETEIDVEKSDRCPTCEGSGAKPGTQPDTCQYCQGSGQISRTQGFFSVRTTCHHCQGQGQIIPHPCTQCKGATRVLVHKKVAVKIPAGVDNGSRLRLSGEGEAGGYGGIPGDLYVFIHVEPHEFFQREDTHVICRIPISFVQAALGDRIEIPTLNGKEKLDIPRGTQPGELFRITGMGIPSLRSGRRGDQIIQVDVRTPTNLNKQQQQLLKEFSRIESRKLTSKLKTILKSGADRAAQ